MLSVSPTDAATDVHIDEVLRVRFDADVDPATVSTANVTLEADWGVTRTAVPVTVGVAGDTVTIQPVVPLLYNATYTATVQGQISSVAGAALTGSVSWTFVTERRNIVTIGGPAFTTGFTAQRLYFLSPSHPPLSGEFTGNTTPSVGGGDFEVASGETKTVALSDLTATTWRDFVVNGALVVTGTSTTVEDIEVKDNLIVTGSMSFRDRPISVRFMVAGQTTITGHVDLSGTAPGEDGGNLWIVSERDVYISGTIVTRSLAGDAGYCRIVEAGPGPVDVVMLGEVDARSLVGSSQYVSFASNDRLIIRGIGIAATGRSGSSPTPGGLVIISASQDITMEQGVTISALGGAGDGLPGGQGGTVAFCGVSVLVPEDQLDFLQLDGTVVVNGGAGTTRGAGGKIYLSEDPVHHWLNGNEAAPDNASWLTATISGTLEALGTGAEIRFHALDPSGAAAFEIQDGAVVRAPDGLLTRHALTSVTVTGSPTIVDSDGDQDAPPDGTPVDVK